jgi:hypothetical protein
LQKRFDRAAKGSCLMRYQQKHCCDRKYQNGFEFRPSSLMTDFITVHTFGGRGSPSF